MAASSCRLQILDFYANSWIFMAHKGFVPTLLTYIYNSTSRWACFLVIFQVLSTVVKGCQFWLDPLIGV